jgi:hypothetical protein
MRRARGALGMGVAWAAGGVGVGGTIELLDNVLPGGLAMASAVDMWPQTLAIPGFLGGVIFGVVLGIAGSRRRFDELSLPRFAAWGALTGVLLGALGMSLGAPLAFLAVITLASVVAASASLAVARMARGRELLGVGADVPELGRVPGRTAERLGNGR